MPEWTGYWLDDRTFLTQAIDKDGIMQWCMITTSIPRDKNGNITYDHLTGKLFDLEIIDPDNFYWKGQHLKMRIE